MSELVRKLAQRLERRLAVEMERIRGDVQQRISKPVGPNGERSKPGEPPRKDTGRLYTSASAQTVDATNTVLGSVSLDTPYIRKLRASGREPFGPILQDNRTAILDAMREAATDRS